MKAADRLPKPPTFVLLLAAMVSLVASSRGLAASPNVVILLADDLGWGDVGFHDGIADTPHLDRLAKESLELTRFYAFPSCSAARAALLTGRFPQRYGIVGPVKPRDEGLPSHEVIIPADFQRAGYRTSLIGKWHLSSPVQTELHPLRRGFDHFYGFMGASIDYYAHHTSNGRDDWQRNGKPLVEEGYSTDLLAADAVSQIRQRGDQPFCVVVSFNAPHSPFQAPEELVKEYSEQGGRTATYAAMVESMDSAIGRILATLDSEGIRDDTIVVFTSDNGAARMGSNAPFSGVKRQVLEGGIHVPCLIRFPNKLAAGKKNDQLIAIYDLFPTLAAACDVALDGIERQPLDGMDLWSSLAESDARSRDVVIAESDFTLIRDRWKLIQTASGETRLYDLFADPSEADNVASSHPKTTADLARALTDFRQNLDRTNAQSASTIASTTASGQGVREGSDFATFELDGDVQFSLLGDERVESAGKGLRLTSGKDLNGDGSHSGNASTWVDDVSDRKDRWYRLQMRGSAQDGFKVDQDELFLKVEFFKNDRKDPLDFIKTRIYAQVERERDDFRDEGTNKNLGAAIWRTYAMDFRTPFPQIESFRLSVGFANGKGSGPQSEFHVRSLELIPITAPESFPSTKRTMATTFASDLESSELVHLGGRWYYEPTKASKAIPEQFDHRNSHRILYKTDRFERPFAGNMTAWLRAGYLDLEGDPVTQDRQLQDNVIIKLTESHLVMHSKNIPNHPTASFPDRWRMLDGNPAYIKEQANVWHIPLQPTVNTDHFAMDRQNQNQALPMGAIGVATNGVIFFNPFDHIFEADATWRLDRCCGHPSPQNQYHYHKYPVCVKTPWIDDGTGHSPVIGFAFDGYPVYGPYEAKDLLAMDDVSNPLNDFNLHEDEARGPHYHVTPGRFPHIIGGYWGNLEQLNRPARRRQGR